MIAYIQKNKEFLERTPDSKEEEKIMRFFRSSQNKTIEDLFWDIKKKRPPGLPYHTISVTLPDCSSVTSCVCVYVCDRHRDFERGTERKTGTKRDRERNNYREKVFFFLYYLFFLALAWFSLARRDRGIIL